MDALLVTVESEYVEVRSGVSVVSGKPYVISNQVVWAYMVDPSGVVDKHPTKISLPLNKDQKPYKPGQYFMHPSSIYQADYQRFGIRAFLYPVAKAA